MKVFSVAIMTGFISLPQPARAWSFLGHQTAAVIALEYLSPKATKELEIILNGEAIEKAATWPDSIRSKPEWKHAKYYHYKNLSPGDDYFSDLKNSVISKRDRSDVVRALLHAEDVIIDPTTTARDRKNALRFFIHLIADLHQPLHAGFYSDSGGNSYSMPWYGVKTNLHSVWDGKLLQSYGKIQFPTEKTYDPRALAQSFKAVSGGTLLQWKKGSYVDWLNESISIRDEAYSNVKIPSDSYYAAHIDSVEVQLQKAGFRLALLLESLLAKTPTLPSNNLSLRKSILTIIGLNEVNFNTDLELDAFTLFRFDSSYRDDDAHADCQDH